MYGQKNNAVVHSGINITECIDAYLIRIAYMLYEV